MEPIHDRTRSNSGGSGFAFSSCSIVPGATKARTMRFLPFFLALILAGPVACGDDGTSNDDDDVPIGLTISELGIVQVSVELATVQGEISVEPGQATRTLTVEFLNTQGLTVSADGRYMEVEVSNPALVTWEPTAPGSLTGKFLGGPEGGTTTAIVTLLEGAVGSGTPVYISPEITVRVEGQVCARPVPTLPHHLS